MTYHQISIERVEERRQPPGSRPVFEIDLQEHQRIIGVAQHGAIELPGRKTVDHWAYLWIDNDLGDPERG